MKTTNRSMCSTIYEPTDFQTNYYKLWDELELAVTIHRTYEGLSSNSLFSMALRVNKKRQFLFVSPLLAKHLAVHPALALGTGTLLASLLMEDAGLPANPHTQEIVRMIETGAPDQKMIEKALDYRSILPERTVFIGMAETATGLGHAVFHHFDEAVYLHTTREEITGLTPSFVFEEEHSHATSHKVYAAEGVLEAAEAIVLIDDEISTGNTLLNLVSALDEQFPGKTYKSLSILDWRNENQQLKLSEMAEERNIRLDVLSLMSGEFSLIHGSSPDELELAPLAGTGSIAPVQLEEPGVLRHHSETGQRYVPFTGRFGLTSAEHQNIGDWAKKAVSSLRTEDTGKRPLVIGVGENMYLPLRFALALSGDPLVQTTTRSPIFASNTDGYPIKEKVKFKLPDANGIDQFLYNLNGLDIDKIYLISESVVIPALWQPLLAYLKEKAPVEWVSLA
ncbi:phosphoribosyltransferase family protein [Planomicrobium sp. CPCC 101079]|uniref:phosphoribosyltransferase family protein n=1 Tax=Planomicrobium sp. CPCC 101079 TaxID=2599618 RepID=UPI0011B7AC3F|nr:phosphoribosyltransferase family protein [Planomicrobium sp. CPCC 101079]TWT16060.1 adenine/guanine phosphoribosyltransferase [Planomicrobium sp. CPCC 101079]